MRREIDYDHVRFDWAHIPLKQDFFEMLKNYARLPFTKPEGALETKLIDKVASV